MKKKQKTPDKTIEEGAIDYVMAHPQFKKELGALAQAVRTFAATAPNEATLAANLELKLHALMARRLHVQFEPAKEVAIDTARHIKRGRIDARIGALIIEYKQKSKLTTVKDQDSAVSQLKTYVESLPPDVRRGAVGVLTDGWRIKFVSYEENGSFSETTFEDLNAEHLLRLIRGILSLDKKALTPGNLIAGFCKGDPSPSTELATALYGALQDHPTGRSRMLFQEWQAIFKLAHDDKSKQSAIEERRSALAGALNIKIPTGSRSNETEYKALYAIQTSYAIIVKIIAFKVLSSIRSQQTSKTFGELAEGSSASLRTHLDRLESGDIFRQEGFGNLLEGDFFSWYCADAQWDDSIAAAIKQIFSILSEYENHHMFDGGRVQDLFKDLYMAIIPDKVRHSMGEFYTPPWLAEHTILEALSQTGRGKAWTALDPCCGSGTFVIVLIRLVLDEVRGKPKQEQLRQVLDRVKSIDLNPLAVLTTRINYFINLSHLIGDEDEFDMPVYLGDASYVPALELVGNVKCLTYQIGTDKGPLKVTLPASAVADVARFSRTMTMLETHIQNENEGKVSKALCDIVAPADLTEEVQAAIGTLAKKLVDLQRNNWNGIWARIIGNFLTTANLGKFDIIVSNPPWIDWKNLPEGYRDRIKKLCVSRHLFSGDGVTGGINLNVCALISSVAAQNWLQKDGTLAFLMPENLIFQQSYEGFRNFLLDDGGRMYFQKFIDWTKAGHPFAPVQHRFLAFIIGTAPRNYATGVPVDQYAKKARTKDGRNTSLKAYTGQQHFVEVEHLFDKHELIALTASAQNTAFSYASDRQEGKKFSAVAGKCSYAGRDGVSVYPQELFLLTVDPSRLAKKGRVYVTNFQNPRAKHRIAPGTFLLETEFLYPLVRGVDIDAFHVNDSGYVVPFPYDSGSRSPVPAEDLAERAPNLMRYLNDNKGQFDAQSSYNSKIIGEKHGQEFYALPRVGAYSYADHFLAFRHNTKWRAAVVSNLPTVWEETGKRPVFQSHACSISQRVDGSFITLDEAHFICAIFNAPIVADYIVKSSDARSFKIRPPINVPLFEPKNPLHRALADLSLLGHRHHGNTAKMADIYAALDKAYLAILT